MRAYPVNSWLVPKYKKHMKDIYEDFKNYMPFQFKEQCILKICLILTNIGLGVIFKVALNVALHSRAHWAL